MIHNEKHTSSVSDALSRLFAVSILMADDIDRGLAERGLTRARARALWEISLRETVTQREIADALKVTPRNVTTLVDALEETGFVQRTSHETDRRAIVVELTRKGRAAAARMRQETRELAERLFRGASEADLKAFIRTLDGVIGELEEMVPKAGR
jgi:DNA-binding MarR family transcriptional regulator